MHLRVVIVYRLKNILTRNYNRRRARTVSIQH